MISQQLTLVVLKRIEGGSLKRWIELLALAMPVSLLFLFSLTMLPGILSPATEHETDSQMHRDWLLSLTGIIIFVTPIVLTLLFNVFRLTWLYRHTRQNTWAAPAGLEKLLKDSSIRVQIRLWHSTRPFAFNLPGLWPGRKPIIVVSTRLVADLDEEELQAVLWHETSHLVHLDFWIIWLVDWWRLAFFYLPVSKRLFGILKEDQELACDERVARLGGNGLALALAGALIKVWEQTQTLTFSESSKSWGFRAPGLASTGSGEVDLTEHRINRLLDWEKIDLRTGGRTSFRNRLRTLGFLGGSVGLWFCVLEVIHLLMLPMGCAITFGLF
jgi:Zn-dependent protease with chaperone function